MDLRNKYGYERSMITDCDVLLYQGKNYFSRLIRKVIKSEYSHAGLAVWWGDRLMVVEAIGKGVVVTPMSQNLRHYKGPVHLFKPKTSLSTVRRNRMIKQAHEELGKEYATWKMVVFGLKILFKRDFDQRDELKQANKLYCSQFVAQVYNAGGVDLKKNKADRFMSPLDVATSDKLVKITPDVY